MQVKNLSDTPFQDIISCFLAAFENYYVPMPTNPNYYRNRWVIAGVDFSCSYGMFVGDELVGFIIHAIDERNGDLIAFNTGTGVLPAYRGRRIVKTIYEYALEELKKKGVTKYSLEVIRENEVAIKAYESIGFTIVKRYKCFQGRLDLNLDFNVAAFLQKSSKETFRWDELPSPQNYSWDFQRETIVRGEYDYYYVINAGTIEAYFIIDPNSGNLAQFDVLTAAEGSWNRLFWGVQQVAEVVKIINVAESLTEKVNFIEQIGLTNTVNQYEMEMVALQISGFI